MDKPLAPPSSRLPMYHPDGRTGLFPPSTVALCPTCGWPMLGNHTCPALMPAEGRN